MANNMMIHITFSLRISIKPTASFAVVMDLWLVVELYVQVLCFHGSMETILLQASMRDL